MPAHSASDPALLALVLTIRTRSGPRVVFHYPSQPAAHFRSHRHARHASLDTQSSSSSTSGGEDNTTNPGASETEDDGTSSSHKNSHHSGHSTANAVVGASNNSQHTRAESGSNKTSSGGAAPSAQEKKSRRARTLREEGPEEYQDDYEDDEPRRGVTAGGAGPSTSGITSAANAAGRPSGDAGGALTSAGPGTSGDGVPRTAEWESVLGYPTPALAKLLCPTRDARKRRFEVGLADTVFLGYPTFVRDDGGWRKRRGQQRKSRGAGNASGTIEGAQDIRKAVGRARLGDDLAGAGASAGSQAVTFVPGSLTSQGALSEPASESKSMSSASGGEGGSELSMYHVVFVMNPPPLQHQAKVAEMYENVVKKFAKALKYEQARTGYVWTESTRILEMKSRAKEDGTPMNILWPQILQASPLARSIANLFSAISTNNIAHVSIGETVDASMQIPQTMSTPSAPTPADPQTPGLWVTTASMLEEDGTLSPHAALLLIEDKETLLKEIESDNRELAAPLGYFIRELTPTKSLQKMAIRLSLRLPDLQFLARHLIYWRRARAIPPLHIRDIYIVSPLADLRSFSSTAEAFERRFPGLPSLARILQSLSSRPLPYGYLIPSQDHKPVYMDILAWLLRANLVTQLRTFAWVRVSSEIKIKAAMQAKKEDPKGSTKGKSSKRDSTASGLSGSGLERKITNDSVSEDERSRGDMSAAAGILSPLLKPTGESNKSETASVGSNRTAVQLSQGSGLGPGTQTKSGDAPSPLSMTSKMGAATEDGSGAIPPLDLAAHEASVILSPQKANTEEARWLSLIKESLPDEDLKAAWPVLSVYFDGRWAMEDVAAREGMKRSRVANLIARLEREGVLCIARHW